MHRAISVASSRANDRLQPRDSREQHRPKRFGLRSCCNERISLFPCGARPRRHRRGVWRHRNIAAVCVQGGVRQRPRGGHARQHPRHPVAVLLDADNRRLDQVRRPDHARGQPWRRGPDGTARAGVSLGPRSASGSARADGLRYFRARPVFRRRGDHARHLGAFSRGRLGDRDAGGKALCASNLLCRADRAVPGAEAWHDTDRALLRPDHGALVPGHRAVWPHAGAAQSLRAVGPVSPPRPAIRT